jgi:hypothetical protein
LAYSVNELLSEAEKLRIEEELAEYEDYDDEFPFSDFEEIRNPMNVGKKDDELGIQMGKTEEETDDTDIFTKPITDEEILKSATRYYPKERSYRSLLLEIFTPEQAIEIEKIQRTFSITNNQKIQIIRDRLDEWKIPYSPLGGGTNRWACMVDGYVIKIACDDDGKIDNKREFIYSIQLQPYVVKCYETYGDGLMAIFEYVEIFTIDDFWKNTQKMSVILTDIASQFMIGDVGISSTNYVNWGYREDGSVVILDYAYIYSVAFKQFQCNCSPSSVLYYDKEFNNLICNTCGKKYSFRDIRKRISRKDQEEEIGDVYQKGYVLTNSEEKKLFDPRFVYGAYATIRSKLKKERKKSGESMFKSTFGRRQKNNTELAPNTDEEFEELLNSGFYNEALMKFKEDHENG